MTRTALSAGVATALGGGALLPVFTRPDWVPAALLAVAVVTGTGLVLRTLGRALGRALGSPRWAALGIPLVPVLQLGAVGCLLTAIYAPARAAGGWLPTPASIDDLRNVLLLGSDQIREQFTPAEPLTGLCALTTLLIGLLAVLVDLVAVAGRQPALAALPLLIVLTVPVSTVTGTFTPVGIVAPVAGLALLLRADQVRRDGRRRRTVGAALRAGALAATALVAALVAGTVVPTFAEGELIESWRADGGTGTTGTSLDPAAELRGQLVRTDPIELFQMATTVSDPGYLRAVALDDFEPERGWTVGDLGDGERLTDGGAVEPSSARPAGRPVQAEVTVLEHDDVFLPVLASPVQVRLDDPDRWRFDPASSTVFAADGSSAGESYLTTGVEPRPSAAALADAGPVPPDAPEATLTRLPPLAPAVEELAGSLTAGADSPAAAVNAIYGFLTDPANGWRYSLSTRPGSTGDDLADFLQNRAGYCEQYASAMAVLVRAAGVPARVVLGYTPGAVQPDGSRLVTSRDAHAWVEVWFGGVGWLPYDPTPIDAARAVTHPYVPPAPDLENEPPAPVPLPSAVPAPTAVPAPADPPTGPAPADASSGAPESGGGRLLGAVAAVLLAAAGLAVPGALRVRQRQRRLASGQGGAAWDELTATARDLGIAGDPAQTPRQVAATLADRLPATAGTAVSRLARAEEGASYGRAGTAVVAPAGQLRADVEQARRALIAAAPAGARVRAVLWPASLVAGRRTTGRSGGGTALPAGS